LHDRLCKRWGILEAAPSPNGKFTVIKFREWERYKPFYANHQHGSTKTGDLSTIVVPQYDEVNIDTSVPQKTVSVPPPSSTIQDVASSTINSLEIDAPVPQSGNDLVPQSSSTVLEEYKKNVEEEKINNTSPNGEVQRLAAELFGDDDVHVEKKHENPEALQAITPQAEPLEGEVADLPKAKPKKPKREQNPDGSFGNPEVNEVRVYFLKTMGIESEDCSRQESGKWWWNLLKSVKDGLNKVDTVKALIDLAKADRIYCTITSPKRLFYKRNELMLRLQNNLNGSRGVRIGVADDTPIEHDKPQGVKIGVYYANQ
jgi:hypothetical protein